MFPPTPILFELPLADSDSEYIVMHYDSRILHVMSLFTLGNPLDICVQSLYFLLYKFQQWNQYQSQ